MTERSFDVSALIENQKLGGFLIRLVILSWVVTFFDGFDMLVIAFLAPYLKADFGLSTVALGQLFSVGLAGTLVGGFTLGMLGDKIGRRPSIIFTTIAFGALTIALALAPNFEALMVIRFFNGVALGGMLPLCWSLNVEFVPKGYRATVVTVIMLGYTAGGAIAGPVTVWLAPQFGWEGVFVFGGVLTLVAAALLFFFLPESLRYLVARQKRPDVAAGLANRLSPGLDISPGDRLYLSDEPDRQTQRLRMGELFEGVLRYVTPLLWLAYIGSSLAMFFKASWGPLVYEGIGFTRTEAALISSANSIATAAGGLFLMRFTDRRGPVSIAVIAALAVPPLLVLGLAPLGKPAFVAVSFLAMAFLGGMHFGMHSIAGIFYPSGIRASGAGWATSIAKIGSVAGPLIGGFVLATSLPVQATFALLAVCPLLASLCIFGLVKAQRGQPRAQELAPAH